MANEPIGSGNPGSPNLAGPALGQPAKQIDYQAMYSELEKKLGEQGAELGEYRKFFENISPVLTKLDESPELVQAIVDGKIDKELAQAITEGKITIGDAQAVTQAHEQVQKELGKRYDKVSVDDVAKLVEEKVAEAKREMESKMTASEDMRTFESSVNDFVARTPDFMQFAPEIDAWLDEHDVTDIEVAYDAVKGRALTKLMAEGAAGNVAEAAKMLAMNAAGGSSRSNAAPDDTSLIDSLIGGRSNPNVF